MSKEENKIDYFIKDKDGNEHKLEWESKYYTPEIEEFHVGFEYEIWEDFDSLPESKWHKFTFGDSGTSDEDMASPFGGIRDNYRVKHLDRSDIESLGFKFEGYEKDGRNHHCYSVKIGEDRYWLNDYRPYEYKDVQIFKQGNPTVYLFLGVIKNKSELKRVLKMIGV